MTKKEIELGDVVVCDICNKDFTKSKKSGGFIFMSYAYCPECSEAGMKAVEEYKETEYVKAICPDHMSFADFVRDYRGKDAKITIEEVE